MNHIDYSVYLGFASVLILNRIFIKNYNKWQKLILILLLLMTLGNLFIIGGRTGQFALVFTLVVFFILHFNVRLKAIVLGLLTIIVIYSVAYNFSETFHQRVTASKNEIQKALEGNFRSSWGIRLAYWELTYHILKEDPLLGVGLGDYKHAFKHVLDSKKLDKYNNIYNDLIENHSHNQYLMMVAQMGLLGLFVMIYFLYKLFAVSVKIDDRGFRYLFILFLVFYSISFLAEPLWYKQFPRTLWILFIGLLANLEIRGSLIKNRSLFISRQQRTEQSSTKLN
jgi:O-antigen ligase